MKRIWVLAIVTTCLSLSTAAALYFYRLPAAKRQAVPAPPADASPAPPVTGPAQSFPPVASLSTVVPVGPLLVVEAKDFASLLKAWEGSDEQSRWLASDAYQLFSRSRVLLRLKKMQGEFADAAGIPADEAFLSEAAGTKSVLALYDISKLEMLYVTELPAASIMESTLWQKRGGFESRSVGAQTFFVSKDPGSGRVVAFAASDRYLVVGTREDLVAAALELLAGKTARSVEQEDWFHDARAQAAEPGDLRMTLNMEKIAVAPLFRSYWIQQNITQMQGYSAAVSDLYRSGRQYREERVLLPKSGARVPADTPYDVITPGGEQAVADLSAHLPSEYGVYRALANPRPEYCLEILQSKLLSPRVEEPAHEHDAPTAIITSGEAGSSSDLETRIDVAPLTDSSDEHAFDMLDRLFRQAKPVAMLWLHATRDNREGPLLNISTGTVVVGSTDWDEQAVRVALEKAIRPGVTTAALGIRWFPAGSAPDQYFGLDGLAPLVVAVRGPRLLVANDKSTLLALLKSYSASKPGPAIDKAAPAIYAAGFRHDRERENFARLSGVLRQSALAAKASQYVPADQPDFFSATVASLSQTLDNVRSESVVIRRSQNKEIQTIVYQWLK
jgi:hypothetical protein